MSMKETAAVRESASAPDFRSLSEVHSTIPVPALGFWKRMLAFAGPGYLIAVGYMDPGNWATDISGGAQYAYALLSVILLSNFLAVFLQALSARLGIATGEDLAYACRKTYQPRVAFCLWISAEIGIAACDLAEVLGAAIALQLLFHIPLLAGVLITALDVLLVLALQHKGFRLIEALVVALIALMSVIFMLEVGYAHPAWGSVMAGFVPHASLVLRPDRLFIALGILGATVMPHNLYLHSALVQTRSFGDTLQQKKSALRMALLDSGVALTIALCINAAILIVAAATFYVHHQRSVGDIQTAYKMLTPLLGVGLATPLFAIALLASGQNSTLTGTLAGQVILEGFTRFRIKPWARRMISRLLAIVPAIAVIGMYGEKGIDSLMLWSQVLLSLQLPLAVFPLVQITADKNKMGELAAGPVTRMCGWSAALLIALLNIYLVYSTIAAK